MGEIEIERFLGLPASLGRALARWSRPRQEGLCAVGTSPGPARIGARCSWAVAVVLHAVVAGGAPIEQPATLISKPWFMGSVPYILAVQNGLCRRGSFYSGRPRAKSPRQRHVALLQAGPFPLRRAERASLFLSGVIQLVVRCRAAFWPVMMESAWASRTLMA